MAAVPDQPGADVLADPRNGGGKINHNRQGGVLVAGPMANPPVGGTAGVVTENEVHGIHQRDHGLQILRQLRGGLLRVMGQAEGGEVPGILMLGAKEDRLRHGLMEVVKGGRPFIRPQCTTKSSKVNIALPFS